MTKDTALKIERAIEALTDLQPDLNKLARDVLMEPIPGTEQRTFKLNAIPTFTFVTRHFCQLISSANGSASEAIDQLNGLLKLRNALALMQNLSTHNILFALGHYPQDQPPPPGTAALFERADN